MDEKDIQVFINGAVNYFTQVFNDPAVVQTPYLKDDDDSIILDYTGVIGISGNSRGAIYFTAPAAMLQNMLRLLGDDQTTPEALADMAGEVCNTLSGNARQEFGSHFMISVPVVLQGRPASLKIKARISTFVIPITWNDFRSYLIVAVDRS